MAVSAVLVGAYVFYQSGNVVRTTATKAYYQELALECNAKEDKKCCLDSLREMEKVGAYEIDSNVGVCDYGYEREMLNCADSFAWCKPLTINEANKADFYQKLKDKCGEVRSDANQLSCCLDSVKAMEVVGATKLFPVGKYEEGGEYDCGNGLERMVLRCPGSYAWCQTLNSPEGEDFVPVPMSAPRINPESKPENDVRTNATVHTNNEEINKSGSTKEETQTKKEKVSNSAKLLFKSGFESGVYIDTKAYAGSEDYRFILGKDKETNYSWPINILGASGSSLHYVADDNHAAVNTELQRVVGHDGNMTTALFQKENYEYTGDTQCPYEILDVTDGEKDLYVKFWMKMDSASLHKADKWRAIFEYKTKDYDLGNERGTGYRLIAFVYTDVNGKPYWHIQGDENPENTIWEIDNFDIKVPENEWFLTEFYWKWSNSSDGKTIWKINGKTVAEYTGATTRNSKPIDFIMLTQIYGDANPKYQWIDDIEIWDGIPE